MLKISIPDSTAPDGDDTFSVMKFSGAERVGRKYGVKLEDFEKAAFSKIVNCNHPSIITRNCI